MCVRPFVHPIGWLSIPFRFISLCVAIILTLSLAKHVDDSDNRQPTTDNDASGILLMYWRDFILCIISNKIKHLYFSTAARDFYFYLIDFVSHSHRWHILIDKTNINFLLRETIFNCLLFFVCFIVINDSYNITRMKVPSTSNNA